MAVGEPAGLPWHRLGQDWPNRAASRFVTAAAIRWHVQIMGQGPALLLLHGTGAATHSWRDLAPLLATRFTVVAPDLPGHGFTAALPARQMSMPGISAALGQLLRELSVQPVRVVGHSAGAAILVRMCLDGMLAPQEIVSLNGALLPLQGVPAWLFAPAARLLAASSVAPALFAWRATNRRAVERLIASTGSRLDERGVDLYARIVSQREHVAGALAMMANWDLQPLQRELPALAVPLTLVVGLADRTVPPCEADRVSALLPTAQIIRLPALGHLAHEEQPQKVAQLLFDSDARTPQEFSLPV
jgi:magnesium chelatase accessory protein